ncbi:uncharacterized protein LOC126906001 [Daktulosphaira vitifoliae]|uniref:uncharacterized protein LOC126906001 n=1 Tax=Daktulosphaira vitifoliae TaxID=58002 RepID=UPI0021A9DDD2|nr:uncharacterized protein LOC126906001 [Daktulosphaira vitifoliae]
MSNEFQNLDIDNDSMVVTLNENRNVNLKKSLVDMKKELKDENKIFFKFSDVLIKVLFYKAQFKNTDFGECQYLHYTRRIISKCHFPNSINDIKMYYTEKCYDFVSSSK